MTPPAAPIPPQAPDDSPERRINHEQRLVAALQRDHNPPRWHHAPVVAGVVLVHLAVGWALSRVDMQMDVAGESAPLFVQLIPAPAPPPTQAPAPEPPAPPPPEPPPPAPEPPPVIVAEPPPVPAPSPEFKVLPPPPKPMPKPKPVPKPKPAPVPPRPVPEPAAAPTPPSPPAPPAAPAPAPAPVEAPLPPAPPAAPQSPKTVPATAVQYLSRPAPAYPAFSRRAGETGRVLVRVLIDERGSPLKLELQQSSGFSRLDESAITAIRAARFKPYTEDGRPRPVWVLIPIVFDLER